MFACLCVHSFMYFVVLKFFCCACCRPKSRIILSGTINQLMCIVALKDLQCKYGEEIKSYKSIQKYTKPTANLNYGLCLQAGKEIRRERNLCGGESLKLSLQDMSHCIREKGKTKEIVASLLDRYQKGNKSSHKGRIVLFEVYKYMSLCLTVSSSQTVFRTYFTDVFLRESCKKVVYHH